MTLGDFTSLLNIILALIAFIGYILRIIESFKKGRFNQGRIFLFLFAWAALSMFLIYFLSLTGLRSVIEPDFETWSMLYVRPYFTYLGTLFLLAAWTHPELHPYIDFIKGVIWRVIHRSPTRK